MPRIRSRLSHLDLGSYVRIWREMGKDLHPHRGTLARSALASFGVSLTALLAPALVQAVLTPLLARWVALCWDLPASAAHHHSRLFGLLHHSLEVASHACTAFTQSSAWWRKVPAPATRHRTQERWRLGTALAGLLHDGGKLFDVTVTLTPQPRRPRAAGIPWPSPCSPGWCATSTPAPCPPRR